MVKASGMDVLIVTVSVLPALHEISLQQLSIIFGSEWNLRWMDLYLFLRLEKSRPLLFMPLLAAKLFQPYAVNGRRLLGKLGTYVTKLLRYPTNSSSIQKHLVLMTSRF